MSTKITRRLVTHLDLKLFGGSIVTICFIVFYSLLQTKNSGKCHLIEAGFIDRMIPFDARFVVLYGSLWFYIPLAPWLIIERLQVKAYLWGLLFTIAAGFSIFLLFPTAVSRSEISGSPNSWYRFLVTIDGIENALPSLHAALTLYSALIAERVFSQFKYSRLWTSLYWVWGVLIIYSALALKQHMAIDILAGCMLGGLGYVVYLYRGSGKMTLEC